MNKIFAVLISFTIVSCTVNMVSGPADELSGLWQFPDRAVWIQILPDGKVFQCRIDYDESVISSIGQLHADNTISWQQVWQPDRIRREGNTIYLKGVYGDFGFDKTRTKMEDKCNNPFS